MPFVDLGSLPPDVKQAILDDVGALLDDGAFTSGPQVAAFERAFALYCGAAECVGVSSGLDALRLSLVSLGIGPGDEVIVPALTFVATLEAVTQAGGTPVPADIEPRYYTLNPAAAAAATGSRTRVLLPVHLYGQMANVNALQRLAQDRDLLLLEDACQAHGAERDGVRAGSAGIAAAFSFYPAKNLGALGDAGAVVTADPSLAAHVRALREHGQRGKYRHELQGYTARLDTIHALALLHKLPLLDEWNDKRRRVAALYTELLDGVGDLGLPEVAPGSEPVWHLFAVRTARPDALAAHLRAHGVASGRHYPAPVHLTPAFTALGYPRGAFPVAEALARENLSLPIFPGIAEEQVERVADAIDAYFRHGLDAG